MTIGDYLPPSTIEELKALVANKPPPTLELNLEEATDSEEATPCPTESPPSSAG